MSDLSGAADDLLSPSPDLATLPDLASPADLAYVWCGHPECGGGQICGAGGACLAGPCGSSNTCIFGYSCASGACVGDANGCDRDGDCTTGSLCIAGPSGGIKCVAAANQCFDQSQCGAGEKCVAGKCVLGCSNDGQCRDGFACNQTLGACTVIVRACAVTSDCGSRDTVCVGGACVPRSSGGTCPTPGDVWTENGCLPNQAPTFICANDGVQDSCAAGSICLHHSCFISCDAPNQNACANQTVLNTCKPVAVGSSTYNVCGTATNLGSQCGPGSVGNQTCTGGKICVDGFCR